MVRKITYDPKGFFVIFVRDGKIIVEHHFNAVDRKGDMKSGVLNKVFEGSSAEKLCEEITVKGKLVSLVDHGAYLGRELQKAEACLKSGKKYVQDA